MFPVFLATGLAFLAFLGGGLLSHRFAHFIARHSGPVIAFASGAMLAITFFHVLPEAIATAGQPAWTLVLAGILFFFTLEHFFYLHGCPEHSHPGECENHAIGPLAAIGIGVHSFFDGVLIVFAFLTNPILGWLTAIGIVLHKLPAGAILHALICHKKDRKSLWWIFAVAATTPCAALLTPVLRTFSEQQVGYGLAFSAGTLLYITLSDLLPETHHTKNKLNLVFLIIGIALIFSFGHFFPVE